MLKKNFKSTIANLNIENNPPKWKQRKTTLRTLVSLNAWKIYFDKVISIVQLLVQSDRQIYFFVKSPNQRQLCLASIAIIYQVKQSRKIINPLNGKVGLTHVTKISGSCTMLDSKILSSHFEI